MTDDDTARVEATLRSAPWDLPVRDELTAALAAPAPAPRRAAPVWMAAAAAVVLVVAGVVGVRAVLGTAAGAGPGPTGTAGPAASASPTASGSTTPGSASLQLGGWTFTPPRGFASVGPRATTNYARFGPQGLLNDGEPLGDQDMLVTLETQQLESADGGRIFVTQIRPAPTREHPGPRPAPVPTDAAAAARTIVDVQSMIGVDEDAVRAVPGVPAGPATLVRFGDRNGILLVRPPGAPAQVLMLEAVRTPVDLLVGLARTARR